MADHTLSGSDGVMKALEAIAQRMGGGEVAVGFMEGATYPDGTPVAMITRSLRPSPLVSPPQMPDCA